MKKEQIVKFFSLAAAVVAVLNIFLFAFGKISVGVFWFVIILAAVLAYVILPRLKK